MKAWLQESYQVLPVAVLEVAQLFDEDGVGPAQQVGVFTLDLAQDTNAQTWPRKGWRYTISCGRPSSTPEFAHFVPTERAAVRAV